ncbi:MAG: hypothetical protein GEV12_01345 [Micromonosporaceae bacterium]|nr:hypothetical protein [Micromonosporaceae bacterium]
MHARDARLLARLSRSPREIVFLNDDHLRVLSEAGEPPREALRVAALDGDAEDRIPAVVALARMGDERAREALAGLLAEAALAGRVAAELESLGHAYGGLADLAEPWLIGALASDDERTRRSAAQTCGRLRVAGAGPALVALAGSEPSDRFAARCALAAARASPRREVLVEVDRQWKSGRERGSLSLALVELAARGPAGVYEQSLRRCADLLAERSHDGSLPRALVGVLTARGAESQPLLDKVVRRSRHSEAVALALEALVAIDPELAERRARKVWRKSPHGAIAVWAKRYAGTGDAGAIDWVRRAGDHRSGSVRRDAVVALVGIGGQAAAEAAAELAAGTGDADLARLAREAVRPDLPRDVTAAMVRLGLADRDAAAAAIAALDHPATASQVVTRVFEHAGRLLWFDTEGGQVPPPYDRLITELTEISGAPVADVRQVATPEGATVSCTVDGSRYEWTPQDQGDWYDMDVVCDIADTLSPASPDPCSFIVLGDDGGQAVALVLADPDALERLAEETGTRLGGRLGA